MSKTSVIVYIAGLAVHSPLQHRLDAHRLAAAVCCSCSFYA